MNVEKKIVQGELDFSLYEYLFYVEYYSKVKLSTF